LIKRAVLITALLALLPVAVAGQERKAPPLVLVTVEGRSLRLSDYRGKVVLLNFWATWCPPCRAEMPDLVKYQREYARQGLQVIGVTYPPERRSRVRRFTTRLGVNYPIALGTRETKAYFTADETLPLTVVIDRDGSVRGFIVGILLPEEFEQQVKPLLRPPAEGEKKSEEKSNQLRRRLRPGTDALRRLGARRHQDCDDPSQRHEVR
jgi:thiol-disulfide isomerase/thioredoxin